MKSLWVCKEVARIITMNHLPRNGLSVLTDGKDLERQIPVGSSKKLRQGSQWCLGFGRVTDFLQCAADLAKTQSSGASLSGDYNFLNPCAFEGIFNLSASDSFTLNSSRSCFALCYLMASKLESNLETACGPGKGPKPRCKIQTQLPLWLERVGGYFFGNTSGKREGLCNLTTSFQTPTNRCIHTHTQHTHSHAYTHTLTLTHSTKKLSQIKIKGTRCLKGSVP